MESDRDGKGENVKEKKQIKVQFQEVKSAVVAINNKMVH